MEYICLTRINRYAPAMLFYLLIFLSYLHVVPYPPVSLYFNKSQQSLISYLNPDFHTKTVPSDLRIALYQQRVSRFYNKTVRTRSFQQGSWVLRKVFQNTQEVGVGKLGATWEGPYIIREVIGNGAYRLKALDGREIANSWNDLHLKQYHH